MQVAEQKDMFSDLIFIGLGASFETRQTTADEGPHSDIIKFFFFFFFFFPFLRHSIIIPPYYSTYYSNNYNISINILLKGLESLKDKILNRIRI